MTLLKRIAILEVRQFYKWVLTYPNGHPALNDLGIRGNVLRPEFGDHVAPGGFSNVREPQADQQNWMHRSRGKPAEPPLRSHQVWQRRYWARKSADFDHRGETSSTGSAP